MWQNWLNISMRVISNTGNDWFWLPSWMRSRQLSFPLLWFWFCLWARRSLRSDSQSWCSSLHSSESPPSSLHLPWQPPLLPEIGKASETPFWWSSQSAEPGAEQKHLPAEIQQHHKLLWILWFWLTLMWLAILSHLSFSCLNNPSLLFKCITPTLRLVCK